MLWVNIIPALLSACIVLFAPGLLSGFILRARGLLLTVIAPFFSLAIITLLSLILPVFGIYWRPVVIIPLAIIIALAIAVIFRFFGVSFAQSNNATEASSYGKITSLLALIIPAVATTYIFISGVQDPENFSTNFDNVFHLNAARYVEDTLDYSPLKLGHMISHTQGFYPDAWHLVVSLVHTMSGASIPLSMNAVVILSLLLIWPAGVLFFIRAIVGKTLIPTIASGVMSIVLPQLPFGSITDWSSVYPNYLAFLLWPTCLAFMFDFVKGKERRILQQAKGTYVAFIGTFAAAIAVHPNSLITILYFALFLQLANMIFTWSSKTKRAQVINVSLLVVIFISIVANYIFLNPNDAWKADNNYLDSIKKILQLSVYSHGNQFIITMLGFVAVFYGIKKRIVSITALGITVAVFMLLYVICQSSPVEILRFLGTPWYADAQRISTIATIGIIPLAAMGLDLVFKYLMNNQHKLRPVAIISFSLCVIFTTTNGMNQVLISMMHDRFRSPDKTSSLLTSDEKAVLDTLPHHVPKDEPILGDPGAGASLAYLYYGYRTIHMHGYGDMTSDETTLWEGINNAVIDPEVCYAASRLNLHYILYFPSSYPSSRVSKDEYKSPGIEKIPDSPGFKLLEQSGDARLYKLTACEKS